MMLQQAVHCSIRCTAHTTFIVPPKQPITSTRYRNLRASPEIDARRRLLLRATPDDTYWQTKAEAEGKNPAKDPMAIVGILGLLTPFLILGLAVAFGAVDVSAYRGR